MAALLTYDRMSYQFEGFFLSQYAKEAAKVLPIVLPIDVSEFLRQEIVIHDLREITESFIFTALSQFQIGSIDVQVLR